MRLATTLEVIPARENDGRRLVLNRGRAVLMRMTPDGLLVRADETVMVHNFDAAPAPAKQVVFLCDMAVGGGESLWMIVPRSCSSSTAQDD